jgi:serine/threonine-protein kinase
VGALDERCDVFGLGAVLCVILTGRPPFEGSTREEVLGQAERGDVARACARLDDYGAEAELVRLAKACLAPARDDRPRDAGVVASRVAEYRAGVEEQLRRTEVERAAAQVEIAAGSYWSRMLRRAEAERAEAQARAEAETWARQAAQVRADALGRERQAAWADARSAAAEAGRWALRWTGAAILLAVMALLSITLKMSPSYFSVVLAMLLMVLAVGARIWQRQAECVRRKEAADKALERARELLNDGWKANDPERLREARAEAERAAEIARGGAAAEVLRQEVEARLARAERNRALLLALLDIAARHETGVYQDDGSGAVMALAEPSVEEQYAAAFRRWGLDVDRTAEAEAAARLGDELEAVRQGAVAGLDAWMLHRRRQKRPEAEWRRLYRLAERLDESEQRRQLRALLVEGAPPRAEGVAGLVASPPSWPALWQRLLALQRQIDPTTAPVLAVVLLAQASEGVGDAAGAERLLRRAAAARPSEVVLLDTLGKVLERQGPARLTEAIGCYRAARAARPRLGVALARALRQAGEAAEAEAVTRDLLRQQPDNPEMHFYLGIALHDQRKLGEAATAYRRAIDLKEDATVAHNNLGIALLKQKKLGEAVAAFNDASALKPDLDMAYNNLGIALAEQKKLGEAVVAFKEAIRLKPDLPEAHCNPPVRSPGTAIPAADLPEAHCNLGTTLQRLGRFAESLDALRRGHKLGSKTPGWRYPSAQWVRDAERLVALDEKLPAVLKGDARPADGTEQVLLARICQTPAKRRYAAAVRFYADAFAARANLTASDRYDAACSAALAASGQGKDDPKPDDKERTRLRRQALDWLRADLAVWAKQVEGGKPADRAAAMAALTHWQKDDDLAGVRHPWSLLRLPADERRQWQKLWADVDALLRRAQSKD